jgi:hypothetical protein
MFILVFELYTVKICTAIPTFWIHRLPPSGVDCKFAINKYIKKNLRHYVLSAERTHLRDYVLSVERTHLRDYVLSAERTHLRDYVLSAERTNLRDYVLSAERTDLRETTCYLHSVLI